MITSLPKIKKYVIVPGFISGNHHTNDLSAVSGTDLIRLYGLDRFECVIISGNGSSHFEYCKRAYKDLIWLGVTFNGDYAGHLKAKTALEIFKTLGD